MKRITVVVITYKQENLIGRALDSVLCQKEYGLKSIIISDDCSPDNNWDVIKTYEENYPSIIDAHRNEKNVGIYGNMELAISYVSNTDLVVLCSGDDALCDGYFKALQAYIEENNINTDEPVSIFSDWKTVNANGEESIFKNSKILGQLSPLSSKLRGLVFNRSVISSRAVFSQYEKLPLDLGLSISEGVFDLMLEQYSEKCYYMPFVGSIYFAGIGISTQLNTAKYLTEESVKWLYYIDRFSLSNKDRCFCLYNYHFSLFLVTANISDYLKTLYYYLKSWVRGCNMLEGFFFLFARLSKRLVIRKKAN